jgi:hypothetical protein
MMSELARLTAWIEKHKDLKPLGLTPGQKEMLSVMRGYSTGVSVHLSDARKSYGRGFEKPPSYLECLLWLKGLYDLGLIGYGPDGWHPMPQDEPDTIEIKGKGSYVLHATPKGVEAARTIARRHTFYGL